MEQSATAPQNTPQLDRQALLGRAMVRDGWLFLGIGAVALAAAIAAKLLTDNPDIDRFIGMGGSVVSVLAGIGLYKLALARHYGRRNFFTLLASMAVWGYALLAYLILCGALLPHVLT